MRTVLYTALVTPFDSYGKIDYNSLDLLLSMQMNAIAGLVVAGSTGEGLSLSDAEYSEVVQYVYNYTRSKDVKIVATITAGNIRGIYHKIDLIRSCCDYYLVTAPYYSIPDQHSLLHFFTEVDKYTDKPWILYDHPKRTGVSITMSCMQRILNLQNIFAVKDCTSLSRESIRKNTKVLWFTGDDEKIIDNAFTGYDGCISVISNLVPKYVGKLLYYTSCHDITNAMGVHNNLLPLYRALSVAPNPVAIKYILSKNMGANFEYVRSPYVVDVYYKDRIDWEIQCFYRNLQDNKVNGFGISKEHNI
ncbi:MAG: dihydrodipicolinate synthetase family protein [Candidatus Xenolissoclinum pacificiensis L6]|uniref:Dihydrodipicolinate synthetase family protein n=1 Tax=Candidatus Xenolissoclinum pacificiensis L6 TaxID=1401685 RepID=W2V0X7_9RICK|nr:MAG: dihydrodipicolinate synthetase family protein [Candidatus Xenolissoclinum pacificiensis L6]